MERNRRSNSTNVQTNLIIKSYDKRNCRSMVQSETYRLKKVISIAHKGNCKYCKERNSTEIKQKIDANTEHKTVTDTILIYKYIKQDNNERR